MDKLNFIINLHIAIEEHRNGGLIVLHKLAYELANKGHNVYIFTKPYYPHPNIQIISSQRKFPKVISNIAGYYNFTLPKLDPNKTISVYAEIQPNNPYNTKHVVRWVLYNTDPQIESTWGENDVYFNYGVFNSQKPTIGQLKVADYNLDKLYDEKNKRSGFCFILHKNTPENAREFLNFFNATDLTGWQEKGYDYLREELNKHEYLLMFDHKSFNAVAALLCGTKVINLFPNPPLPPEEYREGNPRKKFGLAQGLLDITYANETIHLARPHIEEIAKNEEETIEKFISYWQKKLSNG